MQFIDIKQEIYRFSRNEDLRKTIFSPKLSKIIRLCKMNLELQAEIKTSSILLERMALKKSKWTRHIKTISSGPKAKFKPGRRWYLELFWELQVFIAPQLSYILSL